MKSLKIISFSLLFLLAAAAGKIAAQPKAVVYPAAYAFGNVAQDSIVKNTFTMTNEGADTLIIQDIRVSCGCTAAVAGAKTIAPGESTQIKVSFDTKGKSGRQNKIITVYTNDPDTGIIKIYLTGNVLKINKSEGVYHESN